MTNMDFSISFSFWAWYPPISYSFGWCRWSTAILQSALSFSGCFFWSLQSFGKSYYRFGSLGFYGCRCWSCLRGWVVRDSYTCFRRWRKDRQGWIYSSRFISFYRIRRWRSVWIRHAAIKDLNNVRMGTLLEEAEELALVDDHHIA